MWMVAGGYCSEVKMWYDGYMTNRGLIIAMVLVLPLLTAARCNTTPSPSPTRVEPAPNPDPAKPQPGKSFPGNVSITFWVSSTHPIVAAYNVGAGYKSRTCQRSCHWLATVKPGQVVAITVHSKELSQGQWLQVQIVQNNNGRILCQDSNADRRPTSGVKCSGTVVI